MNDNLQLLELEEILAGDADGRQRSAIIDRLESAMAEAERDGRGGQPAPAYERSRLVRDGCEAAGEVVKQYWALLHQSA